LKKLVDLVVKQKNDFPENISNLLIIVSEWDKIVNGFLSHISLPLKITKDKLIIGVLDNIVLQELSFKKDEIIEKIALKNILINEIQFKLVSNSVFPNQSREKDDNKYIDLSAYENLFENIKDNDIKDSFKRAFGEYIKYLKDNNIYI
jgi:hypothetical protein